MQIMARSLFLLAQVHQLVAVLFAFSGVLFGFAFGQALQVVCRASNSTSGWTRCSWGFFFGGATTAFLWGFWGFLGASTAVSFWWLWLAVWGLFTYKSAAWLLAVCWAVAFPVAQWFFAYTFAFWGWVGALGVALWFLAYGVAFWAGTFFAMFYWAAYFALWFVALDGAFRAAKFLASGGASWLFTDWFAYLVAYWGIALPLALWVAVTSFTAVTGWGIASGHGGRKDS
jgi:hypothetical protein